MTYFIRPILGLLQGIVIYSVMYHSSLSDTGKIATIILLAFPLFGLQLKLPQKDTWRLGVLILIIMAMIYAYVDYHLFIDQALSPVLLSQSTVSAFIFFCFYCVVMEEKRMTFPYLTVFNEAWKVVLYIMLGQAFVFLTWGLFHLAAFLFNLLNISIISTMINSHAFFYMVPPLLFGIAITILYEHQTILTKFRTILLAFCKGLYPLFVVINLGFLIAVPFAHKAFADFWQITILLSTINIVLFNGIYQAGFEKPPYPTWFCLLIYASMILLFGYTLYDLRFVWPITNATGLEPVAFLLMILLLILSTYHACYSLAIVFSKRPWLSMVKPVNTILALAIALLYLGLSLPWFTMLLK